MAIQAVNDNKAVRPITGRFVLITLVAFFGVVITVNVVMAVLAVDTMPGVEVASPYRVGLRFNDEIAAARAQAARGWRVQASVERRGDGAVMRVEARDKAGAPLTGLALTARLHRPASAEALHALALREGESGVYRGALDGVRPGQWDLTLEADRGAARLFLSQNRLVLR